MAVMTIQEGAEIFFNKFLDPIKMDMSTCATLRWMYRKNAAKANALTALEHLIETEEQWRIEYRMSTPNDPNKWIKIQELIEKM